MFLKTNPTEIKKDLEEFKRNENLSIRVKDLGVRFYLNPNHAFTLKGYWNQIFDKKKYEEEEAEKAKSIYRWVWRDLNFTIESGDIIAIMGANGEGKTTLLRVMAGLLRPDNGYIVNRYRPYLLSSGVGLKDELNGYENIRLGGLFLGWNLEELKENQRKIAEFAELSHEHLSKPMKYYSDGMRARLVFSIATFSDRKVLFMDEILGAGDIGFQRKAKARMDKLMTTASTLVIVSHNKGFVMETATKAMLLHEGRIVDFGDTKRIVDDYEKFCMHL